MRRWSSTRRRKRNIGRGYGSHAWRDLAPAAGDAHGISTVSLTPFIDRSEVTLPPLATYEIAAEAWFDFGIIDGGHGWPTVFVDFCSRHAILRPRGLLLVDNIQLHSAGEMARFSGEDPEIELPRPSPRCQPHTLVALVTPVSKVSCRLVDEIQPGHRNRLSGKREWDDVSHD